MAKIDILAEQTNFLFEKHKDTLEFFKNEIESLEELIQEEKSKVDPIGDEYTLDSFKHVESLLSKEKTRTLNQIEKDVKFLGEQLEAIKAIQAMDDEKKKDELCDMMLEDEKELPETKSFKEKVEHESEESQQSFKNMIEDIKEILTENGVTELEAVLEARLTGDPSFAEASDGKLEEKNESENCGSCSSCEGCDIFGGLEESEEDKEG